MTPQLCPADLAARIKSGSAPRLLDVREDEEHQFAALPGSKLIPLGQLPGRVGEIESWKHEPVVVYCHHGVRSLHAIGWLREQGFAHLENLAGGIDRWSLEVDPSLPRY